jgi:hypothetical protein
MKKNLKMMLFIVVLILFIMMLISCGSPRNNKYRTIPTITATPPSRIILKDSNQGIIILEVDGHEYLSSTRGGFVHLRSCK